MQINSKKLKRDCFIAVAVPICLFALFQLYAKSLPAFGILVLTTSGAMIVTWYLYRFFTGLEDMTWREQLSSVLKRVSTPVLITDLDHKITYVNESFMRLPLANLLSSHEHFPELLASLDATEDSVEKCKKIKQFKETFDVLTGKLKAHTEYHGFAYEWVLVPLFTPTNNRWGTVIECIHKGPKTQDERTNEIIFENPTVYKGLSQTNQARIIIDPHGNILNANTAMLNLFLATDALDKSNAWQERNFFDLIEEIIPEVIQPMQNALNSLKTATFICEFNDKVYDWTIQPIFEDNQWCGNLIEVEYPSRQEYKMLQESWKRSEHHKDQEPNDREHLKELSQMLIEQSARIQSEIATLVIEREQATNPQSQEVVHNAINSAQVALAKTMSYAETVTLISQQLHENQTYIQQLQKLMEKFTTLPVDVAHGHFTKVSKDVIESLASVKQVLSAGKQRLSELLVNFDDLRQSWLGAMSELRNGTIEANIKQVHLAHAKASEKIVIKLEALKEIASKIFDEAKNAPIEFAPVANNNQQPFDQVLIDRDAKKHTEEVLLEDVKGGGRL
ncbi:MAG: hypothetical protein AB7I18_08120 [Candidatus Berkiella sp.]